MKKSKPTRGHKCQGVIVSVHVTCECLWASSYWNGTDARKNAYAEWRSHIEKCTTVRP